MHATDGSTTYREFAHLYGRGSWPGFAERMATAAAGVLQRLGVEPSRLLDVACGQGHFAAAMARGGTRVVVTDRSPEMLDYARERAQKEAVSATFVRADMRQLCFRPVFDVATCWYDSLNYLLAQSDLRATFVGVSEALKTHGLFIFDMNTIYGLAVRWQRSAAHVELDTADHFLVGLPRFDWERSVASVRLVGFARRGNEWVRVEEEHHEKGYTLAEIRATIEAARLKELACWGDLEQMTAPASDAGRVWFLTSKK